jgi:hypothetical protein
MGDCSRLGAERDSSPSPSPRTRRRGITDSIAQAISTRRLIFGLLSLSQRERMKVRDCYECDFQAPTKSLQARYRVPRGFGDSRNGQRQFLVQLEISPVSYRVSRAGGNHAPSHPIRSRASGRGNRNLGRRGQSGAVAGIYKWRTFDFEDVAREYIRNRSRFCGGNGRGLLPDSLITAVSCEKRNYRPLTSILSPRAGRGGAPHYYHHALGSID